MDLSRLEELKEKLTRSKDFAEVFDFFFDHFASQPGFMGSGTPTQHELLAQTIRGMVPAMFGQRATVSNMLLLAIPGTCFIHGPVTIAGRPSGVIYFDDIQTGILCSSPMPPAPPDAETKFSRFRLQQLPPDAVPSPN
jgi:hypothetical protein